MWTHTFKISMFIQWRGIMSQINLDLTMFFFTLSAVCPSLNTAFTKWVTASHNWFFILYSLLLLQHMTACLVFTSCSSTSTSELSRFFYVWSLVLHPLYTWWGFLISVCGFCTCTSSLMFFYADEWGVSITWHALSNYKYNLTNQNKNTN